MTENYSIMKYLFFNQGNMTLYGDFVMLKNSNMSNRHFREIDELMKLSVWPTQNSVWVQVFFERLLFAFNL